MEITITSIQGLKLSEKKTWLFLCQLWVPCQRFGTVARNDKLCQLLPPIIAGLPHGLRASPRTPLIGRGRQVSVLRADALRMHSDPHVLEVSRD